MCCPKVPERLLPQAYVHADLPAQPSPTFSSETKNTWARDDPAIFYLIFAFLAGMLYFISPICLALTGRHVVAAVAWSIAYAGNVGDAFFVGLVMIARDYLFVGIIMATLLQYVYMYRFLRV
jgi:hypothetical protein